MSLCLLIYSEAGLFRGIIITYERIEPVKEVVFSECPPPSPRFLFIYRKKAILCSGYWVALDDMVTLQLFERDCQILVAVVLIILFTDF